MSKSKPVSSRLASAAEATYQRLARQASRDMLDMGSTASGEGRSHYPSSQVYHTQ